MFGLVSKKYSHGIWIPHSHTLRYCTWYDNTINVKINYLVLFVLFTMVSCPKTKHMAA